jgi:FtsP/CotA-like multicopper oxidase with cupredoxin domain
VADQSLAYSSYGFGDPATPIMRSYLGDPVKQRVVHGGPEVFHVHHVHGGAVRWARQGAAEAAPFGNGLDKRPPLTPQASERTDSQSIGPAETFDVVDECGSGGCQQSAGDFMFHCHVTQHYFAGMWGIWRVYNTRQDGVASTDALAPLQSLSDRQDAVSPAVTSAELVGRTVDWNGARVAIGAGEVAGLVERQLPPQGVARGYDASVFDWLRDGEVYVGEPETAAPWPGYRARAPGQRPALLFDPRTARLAYPFLRPHLGKRPPFAPNHGPAPFLDPTAPGGPLPSPGADGPASICPAGTRLQSFALNVISAPVPQNPKDGLVDDAGELFVLRPQEDEVRAREDLRRPLVLRANAGQDCIDILLRNELPDTPDAPLAKASAHIHFMQFDVQASDGVDTGFNYEQSVRPFRAAGEALRVGAEAGASTIRLASGARFTPGALLGVGLDRDREFEAATIASVDGDVVTLAAPLAHAHQPGEIASTEFVRYRWYPDVQFGTAFFHDHVNAIASSRHGLYGAVISEPPGSTYHDPHTGAEVTSGPLADIRTPAAVSSDVTGSFREMVSLIHDDNPLSARGHSTGSALNLRVEPLDQRLGDPSRWFSSADHGDPATPLLEAYVGDPLVIRTLVAATNEVHSWHLDGHWFRREPYSSRSPPTGTVALGISERFDLSVARAGGPQAMPGDYLYYSGRTSKLAEGSWGIVRVHAPADTGLQRLPGHTKPPASARAVCPGDASRRHFKVSVVEVPLSMLGGSLGKLYVLDGDVDAVRAGHRPPEPLALRVNVGDCVDVRLTNTTDDGPVSFHADMLAADPRTSAGVDAGLNPDQVVPPGESRSYTYYASPQVGETVALVRDWGDVLRNPGLGLYGAIIVGPKGAMYRDPVTGENAAGRSSWKVDVHPAKGAPYRDFTLFLQDEDAGIGTHRMPYTQKVGGVAAVNYQSAPLVNGQRADGDPPTPIMEAAVGDPVHVHVLAPWSEQSQVFSIEGHRWADEPGLRATPLVDSVQIAGLEARTLVLEGGAGGPDRLPGDYLYGDHREPFHEAGMWGLLRVPPAGSQRGQLRGFDPQVPERPVDGVKRIGPGLAAQAVCVAAWAVVHYRRRSKGLRPK